MTTTNIYFNYINAIRITFSFLLVAFIFKSLVKTPSVIIEFLLLYCGANKFNIKFKLYEFLWWELLHIPYIAIIGILSYFVKFFSWRGRRLI